MTEPTASIWEIARLIMTDADADPSEIAHAHGFSIAEVAEMLPLLVDNLRIDFAQAGSAHLPAPEPAAGEAPEHFVGRYLASIGGADGVQVEPYTTLAAPAIAGNGHQAGAVDGPEPSERFGAGRGEQPVEDAVAPPDIDAAGTETDVPSPADTAGDDPFDAVGRPGEPEPDATGVGSADDVLDSDFQFD